MLLLTGATGSIGSRLLPLLLERGEEVRCLVREPRRLGARRVDVQIALGDLGEMSDPYLVRQALRGVDTVIHLAATIRDQPPQRIEELNGLATVRLLRAAERSGVERFVFFSALDAYAAPAHPVLPRQVAGRAGGRLLAAARRRSSLPRSSTTAATPGSRCCAASPSCRCCRSPATGGPASSRSGRRTWPAASSPPWPGEAGPRYELAGPETLTYDQMSDLVSRIAGRPRPLVHVPLPLVRASLLALRSVFGEAVFATWEEAELMEVSDGQRARDGRRAGARSRAAEDGRSTGTGLKERPGSPRASRNPHAWAA